MIAIFSKSKSAQLGGGRSATASRMRRAVLGAPAVARRSLADDERRLPATRADPAQPAVRNMSSYHGMDASLELGFALCFHSNATRAPIANPPNSAQLGGSLYHASKLHPGPCSSVGVWPRTDTHCDTHTQTRVTTIHFASSTTHAKCKKRKICKNKAHNVRSDLFCRRDSNLTN